MLSLSREIIFQLEKDGTWKGKSRMRKHRGQDAEIKSIDPHRTGTGIYKGHVRYCGSCAFDFLSRISSGKHILYPLYRQGAHGAKKINPQCRV